MIVGTEWLIEADKCSENLLRDEATLAREFSRGLSTIWA